MTGAQYLCRMPNVYIKIKQYFGDTSGYPRASSKNKGNFNVDSYIPSSKKCPKENPELTISLSNTHTHTPLRPQKPALSNKNLFQAQAKLLDVKSFAKMVQ